MNSEYLYNNNNLYNNYSKISRETSISPSINTLSPIINELSISSEGGGPGWMSKMNMKSGKKLSNPFKKTPAQKAAAAAKKKKKEKKKKEAKTAKAAAKAAKKAEKEVDKITTDAKKAQTKAIRGAQKEMIISIIKEKATEGPNKLVIGLSFLILCFGIGGIAQMEKSSSYTAAAVLFALGIVGEIIFVFMYLSGKDKSFIVGVIAKLFQLISFILLAAKGGSVGIGLGVTSMLLVSVQMWKMNPESAETMKTRINHMRKKGT